MSCFVAAIHALPSHRAARTIAKLTVQNEPCGTSLHVPPPGRQRNAETRFLEGTAQGTTSLAGGQGISSRCCSFIRPGPFTGCREDARTQCWALSAARHRHTLTLRGDGGVIYTLPGDRDSHRRHEAGLPVV